jgi:hypothetical protein
VQCLVLRSSHGKAAGPNLVVVAGEIESVEDLAAVRILPFLTFEQEVVLREEHTQVWRHCSPVVAVVLGELDTFLLAPRHAAAPGEEMHSMGLLNETAVAGHRVTSSRQSAHRP